MHDLFKTTLLLGIPRQSILALDNIAVKERDCEPDKSPTGKYYIFSFSE